MSNVSVPGPPLHSIIPGTHVETHALARVLDADRLLDMPVVVEDGAGWHERVVPAALSPEPAGTQ
jgi:hypothetical protein